MYDGSWILILLRHRQNLADNYKGPKLFETFFSTFFHVKFHT
jgi:hypothetical protein